MKALSYKCMGWLGLLQATHGVISSADTSFSHIIACIEAKQTTEHSMFHQALWDILQLLPHLTADALLSDLFAALSSVSHWVLCQASHAVSTSCNPAVVACIPRCLITTMIELFTDIVWYGCTFCIDKAIVVNYMDNMNIDILSI